MVFKRRDKPPFWDRVREILAPRKGWRRGFQYLGRRMQRLPDTPHRIALGFACGALASFSPFFGLHFFLAAGFAWAIRGNILSSAIGTAVGNPLTFPFISSLSLWLGRLLLGRADGGSDWDAVMAAFGEGASAIWTTAQSWFGYGPSQLSGLVKFLDEVFLPYLVGGIAPGLLCALACYWLLRPIIAAYQHRRREKLMDLARRKLKEHASRIHKPGARRPADAAK